MHGWERSFGQVHLLWNHYVAKCQEISTSQPFRVLFLLESVPQCSF